MLQRKAKVSYCSCSGSNGSQTSYASGGRIRSASAGSGIMKGGRSRMSYSRSAGSNAAQISGYGSASRSVGGGNAMQSSSYSRGYDSNTAGYGSVSGTAGGDAMQGTSQIAYSRSTADASAARLNGYGTSTGTTGGNIIQQGSYSQSYDSNSPQITYASPSGITTGGDAMQGNTQSVSYSRTYDSSAPHVSFGGVTTSGGGGAMSESIYASPRIGEKQELIGLNARLHQYIRHIREMKEDQGYLDSKVFLDSVSVLEEELLKLKAMYEQELDQARIHIDDISRAKTHYELEETKAKSLASELKNRLEIEAQRNNKSSVDIHSLQRALAQKDLMIEEGRIALQTPVMELEKVTIEFQNMIREHQDLRKRFEREQLARQDAEDRFDTQRKKMDFQASISEQERKEMQDRLTSANTTILALEEKTREMSHHDKTLVDMMKRVRESAEGELRKYQDESEERHNRHLTELKAQIDEDDIRITELTDETVRLNDQITQLLGQNRELEGMCGSLDHQKTCYMNLLDDEKKRAGNHIKKMEFKLREMQEVLINKMRELNSAKESQIPLKAEIESFRSLIEEEERRLRLGPGEFPELPLIPQSYRRDPSAASLVAQPQGYGPSIVAQPQGYGPSIVAQPQGYSPSVVTQHQGYGASLGAQSQGYGSRAVTVNAHGHMETSPSPRPLGPIRIRSAPPAATLRQRNVNLISSNMGQGKDYFDGMFRDLKISDSTRESGRPLGPICAHQSQSAQIMQMSDASPVGMVPMPPQMPKSYQQITQEITGSRAISSAQRIESSASMDATATSCAVGDIQLLEINSDGQYIRIVNSGQVRDEEIGGYSVQQNVGGCPVAVFRFPPRTRLLPNEVVTVWCAASDSKTHQPPSDFVFKEQEKWGTGPECTTIVCKPSGQAVAWQTGTHRISKDPYDNGCQQEEEEPNRNNSNLNNNNVNENTNNNNDANDVNVEMASAEEQLEQYNMNVNEVPGQAQYIRRQKEAPPSLAPQKHPHGTAPLSTVHSNPGQHRAKTYGNDNSSVNRQSRVQAKRPDPIPGAPYAGAAAQKMGGASLRTFQSNLKSSGVAANKANPVTSQPPNSFQTPHNRLQTGLEQVESQHHKDFSPPMPRPPLFSTW